MFSAEYDRLFTLVAQIADIKKGGPKSAFSDITFETD